MKKNRREAAKIKEFRRWALGYGDGELTIEALVRAVLSYPPARKILTWEQSGILDKDLEPPSPPPDPLPPDNPDEPWPKVILEDYPGGFHPYEDDDSSEEWQPETLQELVGQIWGSTPMTPWLHMRIGITVEESKQAIDRAVAAAKRALPAQEEAIERIGQIMLEQACMPQVKLQETNRLPIFIFSEPGHGVTYMLQILAEELRGTFVPVGEDQTDIETLTNKLFAVSVPIIQVHGNRSSEGSSAVHAMVNYYTHGHAVLGSGLYDIENSFKNPSKELLNRSFVFFRLTPPVQPGAAGDYTPEELVSMLREKWKHSYRDDPGFLYVNEGFWRLVRDWNSVIFRRTPIEFIVRQVMDEFAHIQRKLPELGLPGLSEADHLRLAALFILQRGHPTPKEIRSAAQRFVVGLSAEARLATGLDFVTDITEWHMLFEEEPPGSKAWLKRLDNMARQFNYRGNRMSATVSFDPASDRLRITDLAERVPRAIDGSMYLQPRPRHRFAHVAGHEEAKQRFRQILAYFKDPAPFQRLGVVPPLRIMLYGPPGTGKTMLAQALAGESGLPFFSITASEFMTKEYAGEGATLLREFFQAAESCRPCIIFMDELDAFSNRDSMGDSSAGVDFRGTLNTFLTFLDGMQSVPDILIVGATNRPDDLDPALLRSGRFGTHIRIHELNAREREQLIRHYMKPEHCDKDYEELVAIFARRTAGELSPVDIVHIIYEAKLQAVQEGRTHLTREVLMAQADRILLGRKLRPLRENVRRVTAFHEAGHAFLLRTLLPDQKLDRITIGEREETFGLVRMLNEEDPFNYYSRDDILCHLLSLLGGVVAEEMFIGHWELGVAGDFSLAVSLSRMILNNITFGDNGLRYIVLSHLMDEEQHHEGLENMVLGLLEHCRDLVRDIFTKHKAVLLKLAEELEANEDLEQEDVDRILGDLTLDRGKIIQKMLAWPPSATT
ncbi:MAG: AAA family ATPase [Lentisphaerae bacterium]|jgi:ATP-dependent Zn protease|nr:AAA family ATPase [Lentisphaerota bacterium]